MKTLKTRNATFLTGSEVADAVLRYSVALANRRRVELVDIPVIGTDGSHARAAFPVGWQADVSASTAPESAAELLEVDTVIALYERAASMGVPKARAFTAEERQQAEVEYSLDDDVSDS